MKGPRLLSEQSDLRTAGWGALYLGAGTLAITALQGLASATALNALNALVFLHAGLNAARRPEPASWRWIGAGFLLFSLCQSGPVALALTHHRLPEFPSWADWGALTSLVLVGAGLVQWPRAASKTSVRLRMGVDAAGAGLAVLFLSWAAVLRNLFMASAVHPSAKVATLLFLVFNAAILVLVLLVGAPRPRGPLAWMGVGMALSILQVLLQVPLGLDGTYVMGHPVDLMLVLTGVSLLHATRCPIPAGEGGDRERASQWSQLLPILPVAICLLVFTSFALVAPHRLDRTLLLLGVSLIALVLFREYLALRDFQQLSEGLEARVQERTQALNAAQGLLLRTERMNTIASLGAGMAHDLKNLVGVVKNYALLMELDLKEGRPLDPKDLESIRMGADQAGDLAQQLMAYGREGEREGTLFDLNEALRRLISLLRATLPPQISLRFVPAQLPLPLHGDPQRLEQVVVNLVLNARDAISGSGTIGVELRSEPGVDAAFLHVWDTGCGMSPDVLAKAFDPFFTTKGLETGTGLGLASVQGIVEDLGGKVDVESKVGEGTRFVIRLPLASVEG